jgi:hypothetical protein
VVVELVVVGVVVVVLGAVGGTTAVSARESCHWESTYETAPPAISAVTTRSTIPTLRFARPA